MVLLADQEVIVGRDPGESGVKIADPRCSRKHAVFRAKGAEWTVEDLRSKNGTYVNGERIETTDLRAGDHVRIGHAEFVYGPEGVSYRCASCLQTLVTAPAEAPFCTECRHAFPLLGATLGSRRLLRGLGTGSFGSVYVGHRRGNPYVALKVLHVEFTGTWYSQIVDELTPEPGDIVVRKWCHDPWYETDLERVLLGLVPDPTKCQVLISGGAMIGCAFFGATGFYIRNYRSVLVLDAGYGNPTLAAEHFSRSQYPIYPNIALTHSDLIQFSKVEQPVAVS